MIVALGPLGLFKVAESVLETHPFSVYEIEYEPAPKLEILKGKVIEVALPEAVPVHAISPVPVPEITIAPSVPPQVVGFVSVPKVIVGVGFTVTERDEEVVEHPFELVTTTV